MKGKENVTMWIGGLVSMVLLMTSVGWADNSLDAADGSPKNAVYVDAVGRVGIGTTTPNAELKVIGDVNATGTVEGVGKSIVSKVVAGHEMLWNVPVAWGTLGDGKTGVYGLAGSDADIGVYGEAEGDTGTAVKGKASSTKDAINYGGYFEASGSQGKAIYGQSYGSSGRGVEGYASSSSDSIKYGGYFRANGGKGRGVYARAYGDSSYGGYFYTTGYLGKGIYANATGDEGIGVHAKGQRKGLVAEAGSHTLSVAAEFKGNVVIKNKSGTTVIELGEGLDYAEGFDVINATEVRPGTVLVIDPENPGRLNISEVAYDMKVAGIAAGAKGLGSGVRLGGGQFDCNVALAGRVYCNVDATQGAVQPGDLLTTSSVPGYAMKVEDHTRAQGAILGKAMESLEQGQKGQILVLVTLQ